MTGEFRAADAQLVAHKLLESDTTIETRQETAEEKALAEVRGRVRVSNYVSAAMTGAGIAGAEAELNAALGVRPGRFPMELLAPEVQAAVDGDAGANQGSWVDRVFGATAAASAKFDALADATDNLHERGFWARAQEQTARYAVTLAYVRTLEEGIPESWDHVYYTRPEVDQAEAVITWHGDLIRSYAIQAASEKVTRLANETITMLREKRDKVAKEDGSIAARNVIARLGKGEMRTDAGLREQVLEVLVSHRHLIPTARKGHYMMVVPNN